MNYPLYNANQHYIQDLQGMKERIEGQIQQLQKQNQIQQIPQPITQNFQIAPMQNNNELEGRYADNIEEVKNIFVSKTGLFINRGLTALWIKDITGDVRTFEIKEVIELDEKDKEILELKQQIEDMKGMMNNATEHDNASIDAYPTRKKSARVQASK